MSRKIIFLDIDGTLTEPGVNIPPASAMEAVRAARKNGHLVFLCTGRNYDMLRPVYELGFDGAIGSSGGYVVYGSEVLYDCPMTEEQRVLALSVMEECGVFRTVECRDGSYTDEGFKDFLEAHAGEGGNSELLRWRRQIEESLNIRPMSEYRGEPVYKIVFMSPAADRLEKPMAVLGKDFHLVIQEPDRYGITNGELVNRLFDKGLAVRRVCEHFGADLGDSIGFGDSMNDLEMIETVGHSVVMANGSQALKERADEICPAVTEDGLRKAFAGLGLI